MFGQQHWVSFALTASTSRQKRFKFNVHWLLLDFMSKFDVSDEALIDAQTFVVFKIILDEFSGITHFIPGYEFRPRTSMEKEGGIADAKASSHGIAVKFIVKVTKIEKDKSIELDLVGDLKGTEQWTFEPIDGKTKVNIRLIGATNKLLFTLLSPIANIGKIHSESMQKGFKAINSSLHNK